MSLTQPASLALASLTEREAPLTPALAAAIGLGVLRAAERSGSGLSRVTPEQVVLVRAADGSYEIELRPTDAASPASSREARLVRDVGALVFFLLHRRLPWAADSFDATASGTASSAGALPLAPETPSSVGDAAQALLDWALAPAAEEHTTAELRRRLLSLDPPERIRFDAVAGERGGGHDPRIGGLVGGRYRLERVIGRGQMATVFAARTAGIGGGSIVAVKLIEERGIGMGEVDRRDERQERLGRRLERELRSFLRVDHPNVTRTIDIGFDAVLDAPFVVMEILTGQDMANAMRSRGRIETADAIDAFHQACLGLAAIHRAGFVHRDVKPANLFLHHPASAPGPVVKICDLGLARSIAELDPNAPTRSGVLLGSPAYAAPEQIRDPRSADARSDVWSLGVSLYHALTGALPWRASGVGPTLAAIARRDLEPLATRAPGASPALIAVFERATALRPEDRFASMEEMARALEAARSRPPALRRSKALTTALGALAAATVAAVALAVFGWAKGESRPSERRTEREDATQPAGSSAPPDPALHLNGCGPSVAVDYRVRGLSLRTVHERAARMGFVCSATMQVSPGLATVVFDRPDSPLCSFNLFYGEPTLVGATRDARRPDREDAETSFSVVGHPACDRPVDVASLLAD